MGCPKQTSAASPADCHGNVFGFSGIWELFVKRVVRNVSLAVCLGCLAAVGRVAVGCGPAAEPSGKPTEPAPIDARADPSALFVEEFLKGLVDQNWAEAHARLSVSAQAKFTSEGLKARFRKGAAGALPSKAAVDWTQSKAVLPPDSQFVAREQFGIDTDDPVSSWTRWVRLRLRAETESNAAVEFDVLALTVSQNSETRIGYVRFEFARSTSD